jgi:hypothetical protein
MREPTRCEFVSTQFKDFVGDDNDDKKCKAPADLQLPQQPDRRASGANAA